MNSGIKTFNYVRSNLSRNYQDILPVATADNISALGNILLNDGYQPMLNEFVNVLINRIALTIVRNKSFNNPLSILKKGSTPLGTDIQDIYENPAEAKPYEYSDQAMAQLLKISDPDTHVAYYRLNRRDKYKKTITREGLQGAFVSWEKFNEFISGITQSLYSGNYIDEFKYTKALVDGAYDNDKVIVEVITDVTDKTSADAFLTKCRELYLNMGFPSTEYNAYSKYTEGKKITTWTDPERVVILIRADILSKIDVLSLASSFNMSKSELMGRVIPVDKFENEEIKAVICDDSFFQIYDNVLRFDEFYNAETMSWQEILHAWGTYAVCPFANAVVLATAEPKPASAIEIGSDVELDLSSTPTGETLDVTITPADATTDVEYVSTNEAVFTATKVTNASVKVVPVAVGEAELKAFTDNGLSDTVKVTVVE